LTWILTRGPPDHPFEPCVLLGPFYRTGPQGDHSTGPGPRTRLSIHL